jgi:uncharacterized phage protein gp47/JayE
MSWTTPTLENVRQQTRDFITGQLNSGSMIPNSVLRVIADAMSGLAYLCLLYLDYLSQQFLPDTANDDWLKNRHSQIWLGGYKQASFASGTATFTGIAGRVVPAGTPASISASIAFETTADITLGSTPTAAPIQATTAGAAGNLAGGTILSLSTAISGVGSSATVVVLLGGADEEATEDLRIRVIDRIQKPPMGGDADDFVAWAKEVPGVTRAWCSPLEQGPGTVTLRFMMDGLRATSNPMTSGFPLSSDVNAVFAHVDTKRPVAIKDFFVAAPIPEPINFTVQGLDLDAVSTRASISVSVAAMLADRARPAYADNGVGQDAQEIYAVWVSEAILDAAGVNHFDLTMADHPMPSKGSMAVLGVATYA